MRPDSCKCRLGHKPGACLQTLFGLNLEQRNNGVVLIHGDLNRKALK